MAPSVHAPRARRGRLLELAGYGVTALCLAVLLSVRISAVDVFYLDEWFYVNGAGYIWDHLPGALLGTIPEWNRGPQRLYSTLLSPAYGLLRAETAYTVGHAINVVLLASTVVPLALFARRVIASPALRVLAVALGTAIPWLIIASHLLTENLAFPLFVWAAYAIVATAERPTWRNELAALVVIALLALCRLNLAAMFGVLVAAVMADELLRFRARLPGESRRAFLAGVLRRRRLVAPAILIGALGAAWLLAGGASQFGAYGGFSGGSIVDGLLGAGRADTFRTVLTYARGLVAGTFVLPAALGLAVTLAAVAGRLGRALVVPAVVTLSSLLAVLVVVSVYTKGAALEERYVFYPVALLAIAAVAGVEHAWRLRGWITAGAVLAFWPFVAGASWPGALAEHFFSAPGKAFWSRVLDARLRQWEGRLLGWTLIPPTGWLLLLVGLLLLVALVGLAGRRRTLVQGALAAGLVLCLAAQVLALNYDFRQELYGTTTAPGGIAGAPGHSFYERPAFVDGRTEGAPTAIVPAPVQPGLPGGGAEKVTFWNSDVTAAVDINWSGMPVPVPPGAGVFTTALSGDGLAEWTGTPPELLVGVPDDPRVQFETGPRISGARASGYQLRRLAGGGRALWTATGIEPDAALVKDGEAQLTFDRAALPEARTVTVEISAPAESAGAARAIFETDGGKTVATSRLIAGRRARIRLRVPPCRAAASCAPMRWTLHATGRGAQLALPVYGPPPPPRTVLVELTAVQLG